MKKHFSKHWKSSKQPRKQKKYLANAPLNIRRKFLNANLSKELRKKYGKRSLPLRKGDSVKIMRGKFKKKTGKITIVYTKKMKVEIENMQIKKQDGSKANVRFNPAFLQIIELNLEDKKRSENLRTSQLSHSGEKNIETKKINKEGEHKHAP